MPDLPPGIKYFVPAIPEWVTDDHLKAHFAQFGEVAGAAVVKDKGTEASRGFGYVTMADETSQSAMLTSKHTFGEVEVQVLLTKDSLTGYDVKKVHLGKLAAEITSEVIRDTFSQFGLVLDVHTPKDAQTGERKNFGFVTFADEAAFNAATQAATVTIGPHTITVKPAAQTREGGKGGGDWDPWGWGKGGGKDAWGGSWGSASSGGGAKKEGVKYFVPGIPESITDADLHKHFSLYGTVIDAAVVKEKGSESSRGFGYVTFVDESNQAQVLGDKHVFGDRSISVMLTKDSLAGCDVKKVHLGSLPLELSVDSIRDTFSKFGLVIDVHTPKDPKTGERKNFGFVTFAGDDAFNNAISAGAVEIDGCQITIKPAAQSSSDGWSGKGGKGKGKDAWGYGWGPSWDSWGGGGGWDSWGSDPWGKGGGKWGGKGYDPYGGGKGKGGWGGDSKGGKGGDDDWGKGGGKGGGWGKGW